MQPAKIEIQYIIKKIKEDQPQVWETKDFIDFLLNYDAETKKIAPNFSK